MKQSTFFLRLAIRIVCLCAVAIIGTYATDLAAQLPGFFNDYMDEGNRIRGPELQYGARHVWWLVMMSALASAAIIKGIVDTVSDARRSFKFD